MKWIMNAERSKACIVVGVLLFGALLGNAVANIFTYTYPIGLGNAQGLGFLVFLMGCIATVKTRRYLQLRK